MEGFAGVTAIDTRLAAAPVPVNDRSCGLPLALSVNVSVPVLVLNCFGEKVTEAVQLAPAAREEGQVFVAEKSVGLMVMLVIFSFDVWLFVRVMTCGVLDVPSA